MKNIKICLILLSSILFWTSCNKEEMIEYTNNPPVVSFASETIDGVRGQDIIITGILSDDLGIKYATLFSGGLNLNRTIAISNRNQIIDHFELSLTHRIPATASGSEYVVQVRVKNLTGQITEKAIKVVLQ